MDFIYSFYNGYPELCILTLVIVIDVFFPFPYQYSPSKGAYVLAQAISHKLKKRQKHNTLLYGGLALVTYLFLLLTITWSLLFVVKNDVWTQGVLLYLSLGYGHFAKVSKHLHSAITNEQKSLAKSLLAPYSEFEVEKLSLFGLNKLTIETLSLRFVSFWLMPILLFVLFDGVTALVYRFLLEANLAWLPEKPSIGRFGAITQKVKNLFELLPTLIFAPIYSVFMSSPGWGKLKLEVKSSWRQEQVSSLSTLTWLSIAAAGCKIELAGPVMLEGKKLRRPRIFENAKPPTPAIPLMRTWHSRIIFSLLLFNLLTLSILAITN